MAAKTKYARSGEVSIAYQVVGKGPRDLILAPGFVSHVEVLWENPDLARFLDRLVSFARLIIFDNREQGLSDRIGRHPTVEEMVDDMNAVLEAAGSEHAAVMGVSEGGAVALTFAATHPDRCTHLVIWGGYAKLTRAPDYEYGFPPEDLERWAQQMDRERGGPVALERFAPSRVGDPETERWWAHLLRSVSFGVYAGTVAGGGQSNPSNPATANRVTDPFGTVGGGANNQAGNGAAFLNDALSSTVGGGTGNSASGGNATIAGGTGNIVQSGHSSGTIGGGNLNAVDDEIGTVGGGGGNIASFRATVSGGVGNGARGDYSVVGGGAGNAATANRATVPGGDLNVAGGAYSLAAGRRAKANHQGAFVWADSNDFDFPSTAQDEFSVRSTGGARFVSAIDGSGNPTAGVILASGGGSWASLSDEASKTAISPVSGRGVLRKLESVPISEWSYRAQGPSIRHIGPMAQDLSRAFGVGEDPRHITSVDADGISLAAIKGLDRALRVERRRRHELERRLGRLEARLAALEREGTK